MLPAAAASGARAPRAQGVRKKPRWGRQRTNGLRQALSWRTNTRSLTARVTGPFITRPFPSQAPPPPPPKNHSQRHRHDRTLRKTCLAMRRWPGAGVVLPARHPHPTPPRLEIAKRMPGAVHFAVPSTHPTRTPQATPPRRAESHGPHWRRRPFLVGRKYWFDLAGACTMNPRHHSTHPHFHCTNSTAANQAWWAPLPHPRQAVLRRHPPCRSAWSPTCM